jgi:hypothetical protein
MSAPLSVVVKKKGGKTASTGSPSKASKSGSATELREDEMEAIAQVVNCVIHAVSINMGIEENIDLLEELEV